MTPYHHMFDFSLGGVELCVHAVVYEDTAEIYEIEGPGNTEFCPEGIQVSAGHGKYIPLLQRLEEEALERGTQIVPEDRMYTAEDMLCGPIPSPAQWERDKIEEAAE